MQFRTPPPPPNGGGSPPLSGEARVVSSNLFVFYLIFVIQVYHKLIVGEKVGLSPLKGEVPSIARRRGPDSKQT